MKYYHFKDERRSLYQECYAAPEVKKTNNDYKINRVNYEELELGQRESFICDFCLERHSVDTCNGCQYFVVSKSKKQGTCKAHPPVFSSKGRSQWPKVNWTDWCWQFKTRGDP